MTQTTTPRTTRPTRLTHRGLAALLVLLVSACGGGGGGGTPAVQPLPAGETVDSVTVDGVAHRYTVYVPPQPAPAVSLPLVISLHGGGGNADDFEQTAQLTDTAEAEGLVLIRVDGYARSTELRTWNAGDCCGTARSDGVRHVAAIDAILDAVLPRLNVDPSRIAAVGHSNGAMMAYRLGCQLSDRITHVVASAGYLVNRNLGTNPPTRLFACEPEQPVSLVHLHGLADACAPFDGGTSAGPTQGERPPVMDSIDTFRAINGCAATEQDAVTGSGSLERRTAAGCTAGTQVQLNTVDGAGHTWFGSPRYPAQGTCEGTTTDALDANRVIVELLRDHPRR